ncbi:MAG: hypothetical protein HC897_07410 [Thermoanaerobaculia bacterium]|nr:hypothetical protein [Thermoanaerobaculia bacterium]
MPPADAPTCKANPTAAGCPVWPKLPRKPVASAATQRSARTTPALAALQAHRRPDSCLTTPSNAQEIVYRNKATFDYIVENGLWYVEGVEQAFQNGLVYDFPVGAIEVKTNWYLLTAEQATSGRYFTMTLTSESRVDGSVVSSEETVYGLVAMHLSTKDLPNWFWSTFEHIDNPGRCDFIGCHDSFGVVPGDQPAHDAPLCQRYPPGTLTPALQKVLAQVDPLCQCT